MTITEQDIQTLTPSHRVVWKERSAPREYEVGLWVDKGGHLWTDAGVVVRLEGGYVPEFIPDRIVRIIEPTLTPVLDLSGLPGWEQIAPALPSVEDVARALFDAEYHDIDATERSVKWDIIKGTYHARERGTFWHRMARAVLALFPGRAEAEVKAEALREAAETVPGSTSDDPIDPYDRVAEWLIDRADTIARGEGS